MDKSITTLNVRFQTGAANTRYCDCVGLIFLHMENNGLHGLDWSKIPRGLTKYLEMKETLTNADCSEVSDLENHSWLIALMYYDNENGHVGVYFPDTDEVHHVAPYGKTVIRPTTGTTFWKYNGN